MNSATKERNPVVQLSVYQWTGNSWSSVANISPPASPPVGGLGLDVDGDWGSFVRFRAHLGVQGSYTAYTLTKPPKVYSLYTAALFMCTLYEGDYIIAGWTFLAGTAVDYVTVIYEEQGGQWSEVFRISNDLES